MNLVIDASQICYRANFGLKAQLSFNKRSTSLLFGSMLQINNLVNKFEPSNLIMCWDSASSKRSDIESTYKANRRINKTKDELLAKTEFIRQLITFKRMCRDIGISSLEIEGLEGDDIMALIVNRTKAFTTLVTNDQDLLQMLSNRVCLYNFKDIVTEEDFTKKWGIAPKQWPMVKAIAGCKGDNVIGLRGVAEKTAIKIMSGGSTSYSEEQILDVVERNIPLVKLPFEENYINTKQTKIDRKKLLLYKRKFSLRSIDIQKWLKIF